TIMRYPPFNHWLRFILPIDTATGSTTSGINPSGKRPLLQKGFIPDTMPDALNAANAVPHGFGLLRMDGARV
ncbi:MAG TPA: hypothetical protein PLD79_00860, partial [Halothiobacillus sp.]|nr:hypothetical protein [Halothiobacillus sp.]